MPPIAETGTEGPSAAAARHNLQSGEAVAKEKFGKNKNPVGNFTTNICDAEPKAYARPLGFGKKKSCPLPHESSGDLSWFCSQGLTPVVLNNTQSPRVFAHVCRLLRVA